MNKITKNKFLLVVLVIALFIPTIVAIVNYSRAKNGPVDSKSIVTMTMSDLDGNKTVFDKDNKDTDEMINIFLNMSETSTSAGSLPDPLRTKPFYLVVMSNGSIDYSYQYYFDVSGTDTYYMDGDGKAYKVDSAAAAKFLATQYAVSVYSDASVPVFSLSSDVTDVRPSSATWAFKDATGNMVDVDCSSKVIADTVVYPVEGGFNADFSVDPDFLHIEVTNASDGSVIKDYNKDYENGANFKFDGAAQANVSVTAKWYHDDTRGYEGEMTYAFGVEVAPGAEFYLGTDAIDNGEFVAVTGLNVKDPSKVEFTSSPDIGYTPVFYPSGEQVRAVIPISLDCQSNTTYTFTFKYGGVTQNLSLKVNFRDYERLAGNTYEVTEAVASLYTEATRQAAKDALISVFEEGSDEMYFDGGAFSEVFQGNFTRFFGRTYTINPGGETYRQTGIEYNAADGTPVNAAARGKVVYTGSLDVTGNVVILEHGYGIKTLYAHLGTITVSVGDIVDKDAPLGTCGSTGFTNTSGVYVGMFIGTVPVSPYNSWADGNWRTFPDPQ
ncbi:MAG: M23 family metallopeptidase [Clostridia bacterium]|nr:M23 family metallopeptidase [Clostridia bacterium]